MKCPSKILWNLPYFWNTRTYVFFVFHFVLLYFFQILKHFIKHKSFISEEWINRIILYHCLGLYTNLDNHSNLRLYSSVLQIIAKFSFLSENFLSSWTKNCWTSLNIYVNLTLSGLNLWSAKKDLNACLRNSSFGSPEKLKENIIFGKNS